MEIRENFFGKGRGWMHNIFCWSIIYPIIFWGMTKYAQSTVLFPSSMVSSLSTSLFGPNPNKGEIIGSVIVYLILGAILGIIIERLQNKFFDAPLSEGDIVSTISGVPVAILLYSFFPQSILVLTICLVLLFTSIGYAIWYLRRYLNRKK